MTPGEIIALATSIVAILALIGTWIKNNRKDVKQRTEMETNLKNEIKAVKNEVQHKNYGLSAIYQKVEEQSKHCVRISTDLEARVKSLEKSK